jgi:hypothetical protein
MITIDDISGDDGTASSNSVRLKTGKSLSEWLTVLDAWQGDKRKLNALTRHLKEHHRLEYDWAQFIALHYLFKRL